MSSSGIFGPRAPSYLLSSSSNRSFQASYSLSSPTSFPTFYSSKMSSRFQPQATYSHPVYKTPVYTMPTYPQQYTGTTQAYFSSPYSNLPNRFIYPENLPYCSSSVYSPILPYSEVISAHGLEAILIAILVLVSLDLVFVRPLKK